MKANKIQPEGSGSLEAFPEKITGHVRAQITRTGSGALQKQYIYDRAENDVRDYEQFDPIGDDAYTPVKGIVHRHKNRVLFKPTSACAVNCRFCFRKNLLTRPHESLNADEIGVALDYVETHPEITEVILTGGDPLVLSAKKLRTIFARLYEIPHITNIRIHSRTPVAAPMKITDDFLSLITAKNTKPLYIVLHINHADEISTEFKVLCDELRRRGVILLTQTVLLKGVNDSAAHLKRLLEALVAMGIKPYYLHHPDLVPGTAHFRVTIKKGQAIMNELRAQLSGLALPQYVIDIPGGAAKIPVTDEYVTETKQGYILRNPGGRTYLYPLK